MGKQLIEGVKRTDLFNPYPEDLMVVEDAAHALDDPDRVKIAVNEEAAQAFADEEDEVPPLWVRKEGELLVVIDGRQRRKNAIRGNEIRTERKQDRRTVPVVCFTTVGARKLEDDEAIALMLSGNNGTPEDPQSLARKLAKLVKSNPEKWTVQRIARSVLRKGERHTQDLLALAGLSAAAAKVVREKGLRIAAAANIARMDKSEQVGAIEKMEREGNLTGPKALAASRAARGAPERPKKRPAVLTAPSKAGESEPQDGADAPSGEAAPCVRSEAEIRAYLTRLEAVGTRDAIVGRGILGWVLCGTRRDAMKLLDEDILPPSDSDMTRLSGK